jgi:hypothetical protein
MKKYSINTLAVGIAVFALMPVDALAYIDPGTGSILLQAVIAGVSMALAGLFGLRNWLVSLWRRLFHKQDIAVAFEDEVNPKHPDHSDDR